MASWLYALVTGWQAPVIRSAAGLTLFLIGSYFYRQRRILNLLAAVAIVFCLPTRSNCSSPAFNLSFLGGRISWAAGRRLSSTNLRPWSGGLAHLSEIERDRRSLHALLSSGSRSGCLPKRFSLDAIPHARVPVFFSPFRRAADSIIFELTLTSAAVPSRPSLPMAIISIAYRFPASTQMRSYIRRWGGGTRGIRGHGDGLVRAGKAASGSWQSRSGRFTRTRNGAQLAHSGPPTWLAAL